jgi:hypothetical protein
MPSHHFHGLISLEKYLVHKPPRRRDGSRPPDYCVDVVRARLILRHHTVHRKNLLPLVVLLAGCVTAPITTVSLQSPLDYETTARLVAQQTRQCWPSEVTAIKKGIRLSFNKPSDDAFAIAAYRIEWGRGQAREPFVTLKVSRANERASIDIVESEFTCGLVNGCVNLGLKDDVATWLAGNTNCRDISKTLLSLGLGF